MNRTRASLPGKSRSNSISNWKSSASSTIWQRSKRLAGIGSLLRSSDIWKLERTNREGPIVEATTIALIVTSIVTILMGIGGAIWAAGRAFAAFVGPKISDAFESHAKAVTAGTELANEMKVQVPMVTESLSKLCDTQSEQCEALKSLNAASERNEKLHQEAGSKLDRILGHITRPSIEQ